MKHWGVIFILFCLFMGSNAQECPPEWVKYTFGEYVYDIQSDNNKNLSETDFRNYLLNTARANLARQINVSVRDYAEIEKTALDGKTILRYSSATKFLTDLDMKLVETKTLYNPVSRVGYAIAYIDREAARNYYSNELALADNRIKGSIELADNYISSGFKNKAKAELESALGRFDSVEKALFWLNVFGSARPELTGWQQVFTIAEKNVRRNLAELRYATLVCLSCEADIFGNCHPTLMDELKGVLASRGCSFTDNPEDADWSIGITCSAKEYNTVKIGGMSSYFSYVDAHIVIDKVLTSQRVYEDAVSVKGGHTLGYHEAAIAAYKEIKQKLENNITQIILQ